MQAGRSLHPTRRLRRTVSCLGFPNCKDRMVILLHGCGQNEKWIIESVLCFKKPLIFKIAFCVFLLHHSFGLVLT
jgi:hypothetical protein